MVNDSVNYLFIIMSAIAVGGFVLADKVVELVYGSATGEVVDVFQILVWLVIPLSMVMILGYALVTFNLQRLDLYANIAACLTVVISNLLLIPVWGAVGGAWSFLLGGTVFCCIEVLFVYRALFRLRFYKAFWIAIAGVLLMAVLVSQVKSLGLGLGVLSGASFYLLYLWLTSSVPVIHFRNKH
jgi:O-antigen/teichoic acid export membrane protein